METIGGRSDSLYLSIGRTTLDLIMDSLFSRIISITKPSGIEQKRNIIALDYTTEDFYGHRVILWVKGWTEIMG